MTVTNVFQERIAKAHGSQCGFCTPGIVMSMYALLRNNPTPQMAEVEEAFHGTPRQWHLLIRVGNNTLQQKQCCVFIFCFRKSVSLHRLQTHPGGVQDFHCGQLIATKTDQFDAELAVLCLRCVKVKTNLTCKNHHFYPPGGRMLWGPGPGQRLLSG